MRQAGFIPAWHTAAQSEEAGRQLGDTRSGWWDHNLSDDEFNRRAIVAGGMTPSEIYDRLVARGLDPAIARETASNYRDGSLGASMRVHLSMPRPHGLVPWGATS